MWFLYITRTCSYAVYFLYLFTNEKHTWKKKKGLEAIVDRLTNIVVHVIAIHKRKGRVYLIVVSGLIWQAGSFCWHTTLTSCERRLLQRTTVQLTLTSHYLPSSSFPPEWRPRIIPAPYSPFPRRTLAEEIACWGAVLPCNVAQLPWCETFYNGYLEMVTCFICGETF